MAKEPTVLHVYPGGDVTLYHPGIDATMDVPRAAVEAWKVSGWEEKKTTSKEE